MNAEQYWENRNVLDFYFGDSLQTRIICDAIKKCAPNSIFEFGCGSGRNLHFARKKIPDITRAVGIDINPEIIKRGIAAHDNIKLHLSSDYKFTENEFDLCFTLSALDHIDNRNEVKRIIENLIYISQRHVIIFEPFNGTNACAFPEYSEVPHTYFWNYDALFDELKLDILSRGETELQNKKDIRMIYILWVIKNEK